MSYVLHIDEKKNLVLHPACIALCPPLTALSHEELIVIALVYDYHSTLRRFNEVDRIRRAILQVFNDNVPSLLEALENPKPNHRITNAVRAYKSLQFDRKEELIIKYQKMVNDLQEKMDINNGGTALKNDLASMDMLNKSIKALENEITDDIISQGQLKGGQENSLLEIWQKNIKNYYAIADKKPIKIEN